MKPIKLIELEPDWLTYVDASHRRRDNEISIADADGIMFLCPKCLQANAGSKIGVHSVICWFEGKVPDSATPGPGRWTPSGTGFHDLTFVPGRRVSAVSVQLLGGGCAWHGHIANGMAT